MPMKKVYFTHLLPIFLLSAFILAWGTSFLVTGQDTASDNETPYLNQVLDMTGIETWIEAGLTGDNQRIGVLDLGFGGISELLATRAIPIRFMPDVSPADYDLDMSTNGRLALETMSIIAPNATYYVCRYTSYDDYIACVDWLIASEVRFINHSAGVPPVVIDGVNIWEEQGQRAAEANILWINAAGNYNNGTITDFYFALDANGNALLNSVGSGASSISITPTSIGQQTVAITWTMLDADLDLLIETDDGAVYQSATRQLGEGNQLPLEFITFVTDMPYTLRVVGVTPPDSPFPFTLFIPFNALNSNGASPSIVSPATFRNVIAVGSIENNEIAPYSSQGPGTNNITKPDLVTFGHYIIDEGDEFQGTAAASALIAGITTLIGECYPDYSLEELFDFISQISTQDDPFQLGRDNIYGEGYLLIRTPNCNSGEEAEQFVPDTVDPDTTDPYIVVEGDNTNIYSGPGVGYGIEGQVNEGDSFPVTGQAEGGNWYQIEHPQAGTTWIASGNTEVRNINPQDIAPVSSVPELPPTPEPILTPTPGAPQPPPPNPPVTPDINEDDPSITNTPSSNVSSTNSEAPFDGWGAFWTMGRVNIRAEPSLIANIEGVITCGQIVHLVGIRFVNNTAWHQIEGTDNWVSGGVIIVYNTRADVDANFRALFNERCQPSPTPPESSSSSDGTSDGTSSSSSNGNGTNASSSSSSSSSSSGTNSSSSSGSSGSSSGSSSYVVTIRNTSPDCTVNGSFGGNGFNLGPGTQTSFSVSAGTYTLSGSGDVCTLSSQPYNVNSNLTISLGY